MLLLLKYCNTITSFTVCYLTSAKDIVTDYMLEPHTPTLLHQIMEAIPIELLQEFSTSTHNQVHRYCLLCLETCSPLRVL